MISDSFSRNLFPSCNKCLIILWVTLILQSQQRFPQKKRIRPKIMKLSQAQIKHKTYKLTNLAFSPISTSKQSGHSALVLKLIIELRIFSEVQFVVSTKSSARVKKSKARVEFYTTSKLDKKRLELGQNFISPINSVSVS